MAKLRQADVLIGQGKTIPEVCRDIEVSEQTYYRWRQKYGGMSPDMIKQLRSLQKENKRPRETFSPGPTKTRLLNGFVESWEFRNVRLAEH